MDLCMCTGHCPISDKCLRYMGKTDPYGQTQSSLEDICIPNNYKEFIPYEEKKKEISYTLNHYIMDEIRKKKKKTN